MLTHFGNFLCSIGEKGPFKTNTSLWSVALRLLFCLFGWRGWLFCRAIAKGGEDDGGKANA